MGQPVSARTGEPDANEVSPTNAPPTLTCHNNLPHAVRVSTVGDSMISNSVAVLTGRGGIAVQCGSPGGNDAPSREVSDVCALLKEEKL